MQGEVEQPEGRPDLATELLFLAFVKANGPLDFVAAEFPAGHEREEAGDLTEGAAAHAVGDREGVGVVVGLLQNLNGQACGEDLSSSVAADDEVMVLVARTDETGMGAPGDLDVSPRTPGRVS